MHVQITRGKRKACFSWLPRHEPQRPGPTVVGASPALGGGAERSHESGGLNAVVAWKSPRLRLASAERARTPPSFSGPAGPQVRWLVLAKSTRALERACPFPAPWTGALPLGPPRGRFRGPGKTKRKLGGREASRGAVPGCHHRRRFVGSARLKLGCKETAYARRTHGRRRSGGRWRDCQLGFLGGSMPSLELEGVTSYYRVSRANERSKCFGSPSTDSTHAFDLRLPCAFPADPCEATTRRCRRRGHDPWPLFIFFCSALVSPVQPCSCSMEHARFTNGFCSFVKTKDFRSIIVFPTDQVLDK